MASVRSSAARRGLDRRLGQLPPPEAFTPPNRGWIRAVREGLGMSATDLAARLGVTPASVGDMERSERDHRIRLDTLERAADALECDLVYALVPRAGSLVQTVHERASHAVAVQLQAVARAMDLEAQGSEIDDDVVHEEMRRLIDSGRLWK